MSWIKFTADYDYRKPAFTIAYKAGMVLNVPSACATLAIAAGKAVRLRKTRKDEEPHPHPVYGEGTIRIGVVDKELIKRQLRELNLDGAGKEEWQPSEAVREASPSASICKSGQPQPTNMETKSAVIS